MMELGKMIKKMEKAFKKTVKEMFITEIGLKTKWREWV